MSDTMRGVSYIYEMAYELEVDLKLLSESLSKPATGPLIHKIVNVLEELENHCQLYEAKTKEVEQLRAAIAGLEDDQLVKERERQSTGEEIERIDRAWRKETSELMTTLERLETDNSGMKQLIERASKRSRVDHANKRFGEQLEIKNVHLKLKETIDNQIAEMKSLKTELAQRCIDLDAMQQQCLNLSNINAEICEKHCNNKMISKRLIEEKVNIEAQILINNKSINCTGNDDVFTEDGLQIGELTKKGSSDLHFSWEEVKGYLQDCDRLKSEVNEKEGQLMIFRPCGRFDDDDVQGPINKEPSDKLSPTYIGQTSGIQKYFQNLLVGKRH